MNDRRDSIYAVIKLEAFASKNGPRFYGLPENSDTITLVKQTQTVPASVPYGDGEGNISTLGRGGSDTSAVAIAAALKADECLDLKRASQRTFR